MIVSYNGMMYATSRQSFSLGRAGYLPKMLGAVHHTRRTPVMSLAVWTLVTIIFIGFGHFYANATAVAILISTLTAVIWYMLAVVCLLVLRRKEPELFRPYKVPVYPWIPIFVALLSAGAACAYGWANVQVLLPTALLYLAAFIWYGIWARKRVLPVAPEEVAARIAEELAKREKALSPACSSPPIVLSSEPVRKDESTGSMLLAADRSRANRTLVTLERLTGPMVLVCVLSLAWMILRSMGRFPVVLAERVEVTIVLIVWGTLFVLIGLVGYLSTRRNGEPRPFDLPSKDSTS